MTHRYHESDSPRTAVFAGTFNPFTIGHMSILQRGLGLFDRVVVVVGVNGEKTSSESVADNRAEDLRELLRGIPRVEVMAWSGLTVEAARMVGAGFLLRGVRSVADFEYERNLADINRAISGIETVVLFAEPSLSMVSSSMVRELQRYGVDTSRFIPGEACEKQ